MSKYWPERKPSRGFSIEKLAKAYREKLSNHPSNVFQLEDEKTTNLRNPKLLSYGHWANRSYEEYKIDLSKAA